MARHRLACFAPRVRDLLDLGGPPPPPEFLSSYCTAFAVSEEYQEL
jgi:hypothetical protein